MKIKNSEVQFTAFINFQVEDIDFPYLENPGDDDRGCTAWYQLSAHPGTNFLKEEEIIAKDEWERHGITDGMFRLFFAPITNLEAIIYAQVVPLPGDAFRTLLKEKKIPEHYTGIVAIKVKGTERIQLGPQEKKEMGVGMGLLPFLLVNGEEGVEVTLPDQESLRAELFNSLRAVAIPIPVTSPADYKEKLKSPSPPKAEIPKILWPPYTVHGNNTAGELCKKKLCQVAVT